MAKLKKGDLVVAITGKDRGKQGKVLRVFQQAGTAVVEHLNLKTHFERRTKADQPGGIVKREVPMRLEKLMLVCPRCHRSTRVGYRVAERVKQRICKRCQEVLHG